MKPDIGGGSKIAGTVAVLYGTVSHPSSIGEKIYEFINPEADAAPARTLALLRHPTPLRPAGRCYGRLDLALSPLAAAEITATLPALRTLRHPRLFSSPARRCAEPAAQIAASLDAPLTIDDRLAELDFGAWEGQLWDDVPRDALDHWARDPLGFAPPGGESGAALLARIGAFHAALPAAMDCIVMTHGGPLKVLVALARGTAVDLLAPPPAFGSVTLVASPR